MTHEGYDVSHLSTCARDKYTPCLRVLYNKMSDIYHLSLSLSLLSGSFVYRFTVPGVYYYSSGFIDSANTKHLQGVVKVQPRQEQSGAASVQVGGVEARHVTRGKSV